MRLIKTFILRLYIDQEIPEQLCGDVRHLEEPGSYPFKNQMEFEELLHRLIKKPPASKKSIQRRHALGIAISLKDKESKNAK